MDDLICKVKQDIAQYELLPAARVVVGCSGGADSMALLFVLHEIVRKEYPDTELLAAHVHHGIRAEANQDEKTVRDFCEKLEIAYTCTHVDVPELAKKEKKSLESAGREARYAFFASLCQEGDRIAVAHHMEDQAESVAMHIFRGCGMEGLVGMQRQNGAIIRPFLGLHKAEILAFCERHNIPYCQDRTNEDATYDRNYWRQVLFPSIQNGTDRDPISALTQLASRIEEENQYLDTLAESQLADIVNEAGEVSVLKLKDIPRPMLRRCLRLLAVRTFGDVVDITSTHWGQILALVQEETREGYLCLPRGRIARREQGQFSFSTSEEAFDVNACGFQPTCGWLVPESEQTRIIELATLPIGETVNFSQRFLQIRLRSIEKDCHVVYNGSTWFFPQLCLEGAVLRTRREGDRFRRAGSSCSKELRRYMSELHIPARLRDRILLVAVGNEVLWIPGFAHAVGYTDEHSRNKCESQEECWYELSLSEGILGTDEDIT